MENKATPKRGRPAKKNEYQIETRELLLRAGLEVLTEKGFAASGIDEILKRVGVPKGSFYHYFKSKEAFGTELIERYALYFAARMEKHFSNTSLAPLERVQAFVEDAKQGMSKYNYNRGCLIGRLGQEINALPESFRQQLKQVFDDWQIRLAKVLTEAKQAGQLSAKLDCQQLAEFFWTGWEGAVLKASLERSSKPLEIFTQGFFAGLTAS